jgi:phage terminase small subunit
MTEKKLSEKQKRFCDYYIETGNATEAAKKAGYSEKTAGAMGAENLKKPQIKNYIDERLKEKDKTRIANQDEILEFLTSVVRGQVTEQVPVTLKEFYEIIDKEPSVKDRIKAAELIGKRFAIFTEKQKIDVEQKVTFVEDLDDLDE